MEPNELRIGNYVFTEDHYPYTDVDFIGKIGIGIGSEVYSFESVYPIPIIEEWLLKLNFKKWKNKKIWTIHNVLIYYHTKHGFCYGKANTRTKIKYIHTLQNIIHSLTGKELTINE